MSKIQNFYVCSNCDAQFSKWIGRCLECGAWGTLKMQTIDEKERETRELAKISPAEVIDLGKVKSINLERMPTNLSELDRVLGGGIVPGSLVLLGGEPGIGKSTIVLQIGSALADKEKVIYISGEESAEQIKARLLRLGKDLKNISLINETNVEKILASLLNIKPKLVIIDSIQTVYSSSVPAEPGSLNQIRASTAKFLEIAKRNNIAVILIGHITKDGAIAGPKSLEHMVDTVIYLESESAHDYRILRATKNRFGAVNELGIFSMTGAGLEEIKDPAGVFLDSKRQKISGSVVSSIMEGTRPFLVEIQALVTKTVFGYPQRKASGLDLNRLQVLCAVITKRTKVNLTNQDVILNVVGGLKVSDPALDLAVCLAIATSLLNQVFGGETIVLGEVGLGGEVRQVHKLEQRLAEAEKLGFVRAIIPDYEVNTKKVKIEKVRNLEEVVRLATHNA